MGQDSDFVIFRDAPYVSFSTLTFTKSHDGTFEAKARVLSRTRVAKLLHVSEKELVDLAVFLGNDFTAPYLRSKRAREKAFGIPVVCDYIDDDDDDDEFYDDEFYESSFAEKLFVSFCKNSSESLEVKNNNKALDAAVKYSREFYNLKYFDLDSKERCTTRKKKNQCLFGG